MPAIGGFFGWNEPPPAATTIALQVNTLPEHVRRRNDGASGVPSDVIASTISPWWNTGSNGALCSISLSTSAWPVTLG